MNKKSRSKVYDEVGKHLIEYCNGCEFNIGRKLNTGKYLIYIEKDIAIMIKGRKVALENGDSGMKPYMTKENIGRMNDIVVNENVYFRCIASKRVHIT
ncbi:hypothetical protein RhiirA5_445782 [Rhizophagus irregularis]|nr:hypothetical protein RhiirA5_445782 [Rhizophagus irregularis]